MNDPNDVPMPGTYHPGLAHLAKGVIRALDHDSHEHHIQFLVPHRLSLARLSEDEHLAPEPLRRDVRTLTIHKAFGHAPYVGHPFAYVWKFGTDELGRSIAGEAWIQYLPDDLRMVPTPDWRP